MWQCGLIYFPEKHRPSVESEPELPSSTIKTPEFSDDLKSGDHKAIFYRKIIMPEMGSFNASIHNVSHLTLDGLVFPENPVPIVGRISPETVWDYITKMKKTKVSVFYISLVSCF